MNFFERLFQRKPKIKKTDLTQRFELVCRVGQGSMSKVWRARDTMTGRLLHVDFQRVSLTEKTHAEVPLHFIHESPAVKTLGAAPFGKFLLLLAAVGLAAYGAYGFVRARHADM